MKHFNDARDSYFERRFGLFIHWGIYAIPAWHEQIQWRKKIPRAEYVKLFDQFNPVNYDPDQWLDLAEEAGMEYVCFTTKHHDGFCLWDTAQTDYKVTNTQYGKDCVRMLVDACERRNFPVGLYYSVSDWHQPNYPNQGRTHELAGPEPGDEPDLEKYLEFLRAQATELCTQYGKIACWCWDMNVTEHKDPAINNMIRELQPDIIINNRGFDDGDFGTPEREWDGSVDEVRIFEEPTEGCQAVGTESWGYKEDEDYYSLRFLRQSMAKYLAKGGNYLLNVGPMADGSICDIDQALLRQMGAWYKPLREAYDGTEPVSNLTDNHEVLLTRRDNTLYVHLFKPPSTERVLLRPIDIEPKSAVLLNTGEELDARVDFLPSHHGWEKQDYLRLRKLPVDDMNDTVLVLKLEFEDGQLDQLKPVG